MTINREKVGPAGWTIHSTPGVLKPHARVRLAPKRKRIKAAPVRVTVLTQSELLALFG